MADLRIPMVPVPLMKVMWDVLLVSRSNRCPPALRFLRFGKDEGGDAA
jgi:hypothetical protein